MQSHILIDVTKETWSPHRNLFLPQNTTYFMYFAVVHTNKTYLRYVRSIHVSKILILLTFGGSRDPTATTRT